jgi:hypothetical protein
VRALVLLSNSVDSMGIIVHLTQSSTHTLFSGVIVNQHAWQPVPAAYQNEEEEILGC